MELVSLPKKKTPEEKVEKKPTPEQLKQQEVFKKAREVEAKQQALIIADLIRLVKEREASKPKVIAKTETKKKPSKKDEGEWITL